MSESDNTYTLSATCPDRTGIIAAVSGFIASHQGWISDSRQHSDPAEDIFFLRMETVAASLPFGIEEYRQRFKPVADALDMRWCINDSAVAKRAVVLVSREDHCLNDLLYRWRNQDFLFDIPCVISNHDDLREYVEWHGIPFHHVPIDRHNKAEAFAEILKIYHDYQGDLMVLARFMQIIPPKLCETLAGRVINIHHSFLPSFAGARPYHQAFQRGVKLIGATCHYVTEELDAGPIIAQDVVRVDHSHAVGDMVRFGRDVEKAALARGLRNHVEDRVLLHHHKTVVFD